LWRRCVKQRRAYGFRKGSSVKPIVLEPNQPTQFYRGGAAIAAFRGAAEHARGDYGPEDWIASTTSLFGADAGLSVLPDGRLLRDAIDADPLGFLGPRHVDAFGTDPALLVKLLDAGQRLPVHVHPTREFARSHLDCRHGKTEAWIVLGAEGERPTVFLGFKQAVEASAVDTWIAEQDSDALLAAMHEVAVRAGDAVLVPAGTPHAIGSGVFVVELQEPTDFSVMLEWQRFGMPDRATTQLGLPNSLALQCLDSSAWDDARLDECIRRGPFPIAPGALSLLPSQATDFFRAEHVVVDGRLTLAPQYGVVVVLEGEARLEGGFGAAIPVGRGATVLFPYGAGEVEIVGRTRLIRCLPPDPGGD
jgi:mannose-6-phosphate isomerase